MRPSIKKAGGGVAIVACAGLVAGTMQVPASAAAPAEVAANPQPVLPAAKKSLPDPWADSAGGGVALTGGTGSSIQESGSGMRVIMRKVNNGVRTKPNGASSGLLPRSFEAAWRNLDNTRRAPVKGVITGKTVAGKSVSIPVWFSPAGLKVSGNTVAVSAYPVEGTLNDKVASAFPELNGVKEPNVGSKFRYVGIYGTDGDSRAWRFSASSPAGRLKADGDGEVRVRLNKASSRGVGVQMGSSAASLPWDFLAKRWSTIASNGVAPTVVVQGIGRNGKARSVTLRPESIKHSGGSLSITGSTLSGLNNAQRRSLRAMRGASATLITSQSGHDKRYVVITGDSISSGESGRYISDFESANWFDNIGPQDFERFCKFGDLACTGTKQTIDPPAPGQNNVMIEDVATEYNQDLTKAYEPGTQKQGECHRSYSAPGTWLARYYSVEQGQNVESINIACSGATTRAISTRYNGQEPQAQELEQIADFLPVPMVTNTMGANDIGFSTIAIACYMKVADPFLPKAGESFSADDLFTKMVDVIDAPWNPWVKQGAGCKEDLGDNVTKSLKTLPEKYEEASKHLLRAAPEAQLVAHNYPNLIPTNRQSNLAKNEFWDDCIADMSFESAFANLEKGPFCAVVFGIPALGGYADEPLPMPTANDTAEQRKEKKLQWAQVLVNGFAGVSCPKSPCMNPNSIIGSHAFIYSIVGTLNLLLKDDLDWAAGEMIPKLNNVVYDTAKNLGGRVTAIDARELFNGRELMTAYKVPGTSWERPNSDEAVQAWPPQGLTERAHTAYGGFEVWDSFNNEPSDWRSSFVTGPLAGISTSSEEGLFIPVLCPGRFTVNGKKWTNGTCIGEMNEPLHPNWRGQAAQGQCLVAVVTGMLKGNACVRSIGDNEASAPYTGLVGTYLKPVQGVDKLCAMAKPREQIGDALPAIPYTDCTSELMADPQWDTERWKTVSDHGNWK